MGVLGRLFPEIMLLSYHSPNHDRLSNALGITYEQAKHMAERMEERFEGWYMSNGETAKKESFGQIATRLTKYFKQCDKWNAENLLTTQ
jgi:hypothetical protein